jgi:hypothetical protein
MSWDVLRGSEAEFGQQILYEMTGVAWVDPIIDRIKRNGCLTRENIDRLRIELGEWKLEERLLQLKDTLFELRFAHALHQASITAKIEIPGEAKSKIDFGFVSKGQQWAVELMRLGETKAVKAATTSWPIEDGVRLTSLILSTHADDLTESLETETFNAVRRICQKCERGGQQHKFPVPKDAFQVLLVDFRTFAMNGGDDHDVLHVALGAKYVEEQFRCYWKGHPITGVFDERTVLSGAAEARERVHFLGFVRGHAYNAGGFTTNTYFVPNPHLFQDSIAVRAAIATWPLQPTKLPRSAD